MTTRTRSSQPCGVRALGEIERRHGLDEPELTSLLTSLCLYIKNAARQRGNVATDGRSSADHALAQRASRHLRAWCAGHRRGFARRAGHGKRPHLNSPGKRTEAPRVEKVVDCEGRWITPGLIDCHTHLVYAGNRAQEFEMRSRAQAMRRFALRRRHRLDGVSDARGKRGRAYQTIAAAAGRADRRGDRRGRDQIRLRPRPSQRAQDASRRETSRGPTGITVSATFLGAHALPPEFSRSRRLYRARRRR